MDRLLLIAERYLGPISAAIYIQNKTEDLPFVMEFIRSNQLIQKFVDIHLLSQFENEVSRKEPFPNLCLKYLFNYLDILSH